MATAALPAPGTAPDLNAAASTAVSTAVAAVAAPVADSAAPAPAANAPVVIIKKIQPHGHAAHGGAWKIALADMMTAMMAFFLLMWILGSTNEEQRKSIADYFKPTSESHVTTGKLSGSGKPFGGESIVSKQGLPKPPMQNGARSLITPRSQGGEEDSDSSPSSSGKPDDEDIRRAAEEADNAAFEKLEQGIRDKLTQNKRLNGLQDQVKFVREKEGLRIEIIDKADFSMFTSGTSELMPRADQLIGEVANALKGMPNKLALRGHTDAVQFADGAERNNWQLSAERAESTRQAVARKGVPADRFAKLEGVADTLPFIKDDPSDPRNRRISITVLHQ